MLSQSEFTPLILQEKGKNKLIYIQLVASGGILEKQNLK